MSQDKTSELPQGAHATSDSEAVSPHASFRTKSLKTPQTSEQRQQNQTMNNRGSLLREQLNCRRHILPTVMLCEIVGWLR